MSTPILAVTDIESSIEFYTSKLGFSHEWSMPPGPNGKTNFACVKIGQHEILLGVTDGFVAEGDLDKRGIGIQIHIELPNDRDLEKLYEQAQAMGVNIVRPLETRDWGERVFTFKDPDGYHYMVAQSAVTTTQESD